MSGQDEAVGRVEDATDVAAAAALRRLAALLDHQAPPWRPDEVPPLGHWLNFLPDARQSSIGEDGHPRRGGFLPVDDALPRRMWAGSRVSFTAPVAIDAALDQRSIIASVKRKEGRSGALLFVTIRHTIRADGVEVIVEDQDIVYRAAADPRAPIAPPPPAADLPSFDFQRLVVPDAAMLFRFSALTFNAHRIHYDRAYARDVEGYAGLVVQGPFTATMLMDAFLRDRPDARVTGFSFSGRQPILDGAPLLLAGNHRTGGAELQALNDLGQLCMSASVEVA